MSDVPSPSALLEPPSPPRSGNIAAGGAPGSPRRSYRYYDLLMAGFVTVLLCSNLIGPGKACVFDLGANIVPDWSKDQGWIFPSMLVFGAGNIFFPISYIFGDVLTEVYGYAKARKVIWAGFAAMVFATVMSIAVINLPADPRNSYNDIIQPALKTVFGNTWRIVAASMLAFCVGDFVNSFILAKMKVWTRGRFLWARTITSTLFGQGIDSLIFYPLAFYGLWDPGTLVKVVIFNWIFKVAIEVLMTPLTYAACNFLKRAEKEDYFDRGTNFTPFSIAEK
ncbi:MAG: queuosine precursor transporter [Pyrinomonadaceae bacterium]|nr:queuosine precursor transporter [Phycisphaerales bacterium]